MRKTLILAFAALLVVAFVPTRVAAQAETGQLTGVVSDPSGAVVPGASVIVKNIATNASRSTSSDERGIYVVTNLLPALYDVTVEASGFAANTKRVQITVGSRVALDFALSIGEAISTIEVTSEAGVQVNVTDQTLGAVIDTRKILELPTITRDPYALVTIAGNVSEADESGRGAGVAINGQRSASTGILLDGASNTDDFRATVGQSVPLDAVQEFSVLTSNFTAEFGRASGGIVNVVTKSGTNDFHGTAYWFGRFSSLAANSFDNNANDIPKSRFTRNQFGYSVGGPVIHDKLFFFQSTEWIRVRSIDSVVTLIPHDDFIAASAAATQAFFSSYGAVRSTAQTLGVITQADVCGTITCSGAVAALAPTTNIFRRVTYTRPGNSGGGTPQNSTSLVGRVDYNISDKNVIYVRYALEDQTFLEGGGARHSPYDGFDSPNLNYNNNILVSLTRTWSPRLVSQSKVVFNRLNNTQPLNTASRPEQPTLYFRDNIPARFQGDTIAAPGYLPFNPGSAIPFGGPQNFTQFYQDVNYVKGAHQIRFGGSYVYIQDNRTFGAYQNSVAALDTTTFRSTSLNNFLGGTLRRFRVAVDPAGAVPCNDSSSFFGVPNPANSVPACQISPPIGSPQFSRSNRYHEFAFYVQDSWKMSPRLTVNLGMRWEYFGVQHNVDPDLDSNYYDGSGGTIFERVANGNVSIARQSAVGGLWKKDWNNFAPRLGFAWDVFGDGKTSLRGGWGVSYERNFGNVTFNVIQNPPNYAVTQLNAIPIPVANIGPLAAVMTPVALPPTSLRNVDSNIVNAFAHFWSLSVEREVLPRTFLAIDYSGSKGNKLYTLENPNRTGSGNVYTGVPCIIGDPFDCDDRIRGTQYTALNRRGNNGTSIHNALNIRMSGNNIANQGLTLTFNYTWAHTLDISSSTFSESFNNFNLGLLDPFNAKLDRGNSDFDLRHRASISAVWEIPFARNTSGALRYVLHGWSLAPIVTIRGGFPFTVFDCTNAVFEVCPRMFAMGSPPRTGPGDPPPDTTPGVTNTFNYLDLTGFFDSSYVHPITGSSEFGPYPLNMTSRNFFRGPAGWDFDIGIYKTTKLTEKFSLQFRAEFFNAFNHSNLYVIGSSADVSSVNIIPAQRGEREGFNSERRQIQMALKLIF